MPFVGSVQSMETSDGEATGSDSRGDTPAAQDGPISYASLPKCAFLVPILNAMHSRTLPRHASLCSFPWSPGSMLWRVPTPAALGGLVSYAGRRKRALTLPFPAHCLAAC